MDWIWTYQGKMLIISIPYRVGVHYATRPLHFRPIVAHLVHLHEQNIVHGDIRAYNMVLEYNPTSSESEDIVVDSAGSDTTNSCKGWLIDFDFGGNVRNVVKYPKGYKFDLADGSRPGKEFKTITIMDDWKSLIGLIMDKYVVLQLGELTDLEKLSIYNLQRKLEDYCRATPDYNDHAVSDYSKPSTLLIEYLKVIDRGHDVVPKTPFMNDMLDCGLGPIAKSLGASQAATGSPMKGEIGVQVDNLR